MTQDLQTKAKVSLISINRDRMLTSLDSAIINYLKSGQYVRITKPNGKTETWSTIAKPKNVDKCRLEDVMKCGDAKGCHRTHADFLNIRVSTSQSLFLKSVANSFMP
jgi:hypothetical protein